MDDRTVGLVIRALRRRRGWRQIDLAQRARVSQSTVSRIERGWFEDLSLRTIRRVFGAVEARVSLAPRWRGAELERVLDEEHAAVVAALVRNLRRLGWESLVEVTYSHYGDRGSIDVLGLLPAARAVAVIEVKTDVASTEELGRKLDEKARLTPMIVRERASWSPSLVGRIVVMPDTMRLRRLLDRHEVLAHMFPSDGRSVRRWLREPKGSLSGIWFLSEMRARTTRAEAARSSVRPRLSERPSSPSTSSAVACRCGGRLGQDGPVASKSPGMRI